MTLDHNKALALRFFEALDTGNIQLLKDIFTEDCVFHRGDLIEPARGLAGITSIVDKRVQLYRDFRTTIHQMRHSASMEPGTKDDKRSTLPKPSR